MKFTDEIVLVFKAGRGGNGKVAMRREAMVPFGGPAGGDGGRGGDIILRRDGHFNTLFHLNGIREIIGENGEDGGPKNMTGADGEPRIVAVPDGTRVIDPETGDIIAEITPENPEYTISKGGKGGRGNYSLASNINKAPKRAENGERGEHKKLRLSLALLADVGLIGLPNAGKSTLLSVISNARPKIADYPFTTLIPHLGVVKVGIDSSFVCVDIPGIIEGASDGKGLGLHFLKHIEKTRLLLHLVSAESIILGTAKEEFKTIHAELATYNTALDERKKILIITKMDLNPPLKDIQNFIKWGKRREKSIIGALPISAVSHSGLEPLKTMVLETLQTLKTDCPPLPPPLKPRLYKLQKENEVATLENGEFRVTGDKIEKLAERTQFNNDDSILHFLNALNKWGIITALARHDPTPDSSIHIGEFTFTWQELNP